MTGELGNESEFYMALSVYGGVIFAGLIVAILLSGIVVMYRVRMKKKTIIKNLYGEKERKNGQSKGGSRGKF